MITDINVKNVMDVSFEDMAEYLWSLVKQHVDYQTMDNAAFIHLLGYYPAIYQYVSELYTTLIGKVRTATELKQSFQKQQAMDKRDLAEQILKSIKFHYDSLSRKVSVFQMEAEIE